MSRILIIEDDPAIQKGLKDNLSYESYDVIVAADGMAGYELYRNNQPALIILDLMLPKLNGYELCRRIRREDSKTPILMLTARSEEIDRVQGLDLGADDYVTKPFSLPELLARVRALMRRTHPQEEPNHILKFSDVEVDFRRYEGRKKGKPLKLSRKEFGILQVLAKRPGEVVSREELLNEVWGHDAYPTTRTVDNHLSLLRSKLEDHASNPRHLITMHGIGYKLVCEP